MRIKKTKCFAAPIGAVFRVFIRELLFADVQAGGTGKVLDIGCGAEIPSALRGLAAILPEWDGCDPSEEVLQHPQLGKRYHSTFEEAEMTPASYRLAFAYNVLEHIALPQEFGDKLFEVLQPGGVFWALTPHANHPFCWLSRSIELLGLKKNAADACESRSGQAIVNDYPAYYRLNRCSSLSRVMGRSGFSRASFYYLPCCQWDQYFPSFLRFVPHVYDSVLGTRFRSCMLLLAVRLEK